MKLYKMFTSIDDINDWARDNYDKYYYKIVSVSRTPENILRIILAYWKK